MDDRVYRYIRATIDACNHPVNTDIVVPETDDFVPTLTPEQLKRAIIEVDVMGWAQNWPEHEAHLRILRNFFTLHDRCDELADQLAEVTITMGAQATTISALEQRLAALEALANPQG